MKEFWHNNWKLFFYYTNENWIDLKKYNNHTIKKKVKSKVSLSFFKHFKFCLAVFFCTSLFYLHFICSQFEAFDQNNQKNDLLLVRRQATNRTYMIKIKPSAWSLGWWCLKNYWTVQSVAFSFLCGDHRRIKNKASLKTHMIFNFDFK